MQFSESTRAAKETKVLAFQEKVIFCSSIIWHWQRSGHLGDRKHWGRCGENTHENEQEDWVSPGAQPLAVLCDPEQETKPLGLKYRREHCSGPHAGGLVAHMWPHASTHWSELKGPRKLWKKNWNWNTAWRWCFGTYSVTMTRLITCLSKNLNLHKYKQKPRHSKNSFQRNRMWSTMT